MDRLPLDILRYILWSLDIFTVELVCKQWRDLSRQRLTLNAGVAEPQQSSLLLLYPNVIRCNIALMYDEYLLQRIATMQFVRIKIAVESYKLESIINLLQLVVKSPKLTVELDIVEFYFVYNDQKSVMLSDQRFKIQGNTMTNYATSYRLVDHIIRLFANLTEGNGILINKGVLGYRSPSGAIRTIKLAKLVVDIQTYRYNIRNIRAAKNIKHLMIVKNQADM